MSDALRIGMDARETLRASPRGIGLYGRHLLREMRELAPEASFRLYHEAGLPADRSGWDEFLSPRCTPVRAALPGHRFHSWERLALPLKLARESIDIYHGTYNTLPRRWPLLPAPPLVVTVHDVIVTWFDEDLDDPYVRYCRQATGRILRQARLVLTVSEWSRGDIAERFGVDPGRIRVTYNGIHPLFLDDPPAGTGEGFRARAAGGVPYVYGIGAPLGRKNTAGLVRGFARAVGERPDLPHRLLISGLVGGQQVPFRELAERLGIADRVMLLGYLDRGELVAAYAGADLFVYPSHAEGWGIPVLEAQALGVPVAASATTAVGEAAGGHATLFDPGSDEAIGVAIVAGLEGGGGGSAERAAARERARSFTWRRTASQVLDAYREAVR